MKPKRPPRLSHRRRHEAAAGGTSIDKRWSRLVPLAVIGLVTVCYGPSLGGPFMQDDFFSRPGRLAPWTLFAAPSQSPMAGRPIPTASMMICHELFGDDARGYRIFNIGLHAADALLLWGLVRRTLRLPSVGPILNRWSEPTSAVIALIWAAHPLTTEAVAYITQRTELFAAFFLLAMLYCGIRAADALFPEVWTAAGVASCIGGMLSKEVMVAAPLLLPLYDRAFLFATWRDAWRARRWFYLATAGTWLVLAGQMASGPRSESVGFTLGTTVFQYLQWEALAIVEYLRLAFWPTRQSLDHGELLHPELPFALQIRAMIFGALILATVAATALLWWKRPAWAFPAAWFFLILAPTSSFVPIVTEWCAERRMYMPLMGIVAGVVAAVVCLVGRRRPGEAATDDARHAREGETAPAPFRFAAWSPALIAAAILAIATVRRAALYSDPIGLWTAAAELNPSLSRPRANLAQMHYEQAVKLRVDDPAAARREMQSAKEEYARSIELRPDEPRLYFNYGQVSNLLGDGAEAERAFRRALELRPDYRQALVELGNLLFARNQFDEAAEKYAAVIRLDPHHPDWRYNYAMTLLRLGRRDEALDHLSAAKDHPAAKMEVWWQYAELLLRKGDLDGSEQAIRQALARQPDHPQARELAAKIPALRKNTGGER